MSHKERLIELRASKYFYEDLKIHTYIDTWAQVEITAQSFQLITWDSAVPLQKSIYKAIAKQELINEGIIRD